MRFGIWDFFFYITKGDSEYDILRHKLPGIYIYIYSLSACELVQRKALAGVCSIERKIV